MLKFNNINCEKAVFYEKKDGRGQFFNIRCK